MCVRVQVHVCMGAPACVYVFRTKAVVKSQRESRGRLLEHLGSGIYLILN